MTNDRYRTTQAQAPSQAVDDLPSDRIFLSNYVRAFELGAYAEERGVTQRVRFDIALEVARNTAHIDDRPARVVSYDDLVGSIEDLIAGVAGFHPLCTAAPWICSAAPFVWNVGGTAPPHFQKNHATTTNAGTVHTNANTARGNRSDKSSSP